MVAQQDFNKNPLYLNPEKAKRYFLKIQEVELNFLVEQPAMFDLMSCLSQKKCLEIGCAGAIFSSHMLEKGATQITSIDYSKVMLVEAQKVNGDRVNYLQHDINNKLPFSDQAFDFICASFVFQYSKNLTSLFNEVNRVLKPKGAVVLSIPHPYQVKGEYIQAKGSTYMIPGTNSETHYIHHPIHRWINAISKSNLAVKKFLQIGPDPNGLPQVLIIELTKSV